MGEALDRLSARTWDDLAEANRVRYRPHEDVVTAVNLQKLLATARDVWVRRHSPKVEAVTGADWEWWIGVPGAWVGFHVQAKLLALPSLRYKELWRGAATAYDGMEQTADLLALDGILPGPRRYATAPYYAFYNWWPTPLPKASDEARVRRARHRACRDLRSVGPRQGWTMVHAFHVADTLWRGYQACVRWPLGGPPFLPAPPRPATHLADHLPTAHSARCFVARAAALTRRVGAARTAPRAPASLAFLTELAGVERATPWGGHPLVAVDAGGAGAPWPVYRAPPLYATAVLAGGDGPEADDEAGATGADEAQNREGPAVTERAAALAARLRDDAERDVAEGLAPETGTDLPDGLAGVMVASLEQAFG